MTDIYLGDNLEILKKFKNESFELIYIDPPFNTGKVQSRTRINIEHSKYSFSDKFSDFISFIEPRLLEAHRLLTKTGSFFFHIDYREVHYCKILLDHIFGRASFINEIIWSYDYGARTKKRWSPKHDTILWYAKDPKNYTYRFDDIDRIPYMAPSLVGPEKAKKGKTPTDVWWQTIVSPNGKEKTGYPTQKPIKILNRIVKVHSNPGDNVLDFFAGSGTTGEAAARNNRNAVLIDNNPEAIEVMIKRLAFANPTIYGVE